MPGQAGFTIDELIAAAPLTGNEDVPVFQSANPAVRTTTQAISALARRVQTVDTTYYVATTGSDVTGNGTQGNPWATPNFALNWVAENVYANGHNVFIQVGTPGVPGQVFNLTAPLVLPAIAGCNGSLRFLAQNEGGPAAVLIGDNTTPSNIRLVLNDPFFSTISQSQGATSWTVAGFDLHSSTQSIFVEVGVLCLGNLVFSGNTQFESIQIYNHGFVVGDLSSNWTINQATTGSFLFMDRTTQFNAGSATINFVQNPTAFGSSAIVDIAEGSYASFFDVTFVNPSHATGKQFQIGTSSVLDATGSNAATKAAWPGTPGTGVIDATSVFVSDPIAQETLPAVVTFAQLPTSPDTGQMLNISNANVNTWGTTVTGSGAFNVLARYNGANWTVVGI